MSISAEDGLKKLSQDGYVVLEQAVPQDVVQSLLADMKRLSTSRPPLDSVNTPFLNRGHDVLYNLQREDIRYARVMTGDARIMGILQGLLNDIWYKQIPQDSPNFVMRSLIGRSSGEKNLPLHIDSFMPSSGKLCHACQVAVVLEDQTPERGCTLVVPGTHRSDEWADPKAFDTAIPLTSKAGDVVIWDSRLWHGALGNTSGNSRWSLIATFVRWWVKQNYDTTHTLPEEIYAQLTNDEKAVFGYCSIPPRDEYERTDMKTGFDQLKPHIADYNSQK